jgi:signal transduction histidine kinase
VDLAEAVGHVAEEFVARATTRELSIDVQAKTAVVTADPDAVRRAVANLVDNAVRLAPTGSTVRVGAGSDGDWAWMAVVDEGPGMSDDERAHAFDRFWRADVSRSRAGGGAGLGLAIVRQIAEAHGGTARVFPAGRGSVLVIWFPTRTGLGPAPYGPPPIDTVKETT